MKRISLATSLVLMFICQAVYAVDLTRTYEIRFDVHPFYKVDDTNREHPFKANAGSQFQFEGETDTDYKVSFTKVSKAEPERSRALSLLAVPAELAMQGELYSITKTTFDDIYYKLVSGLSWGILSLPFKFRLDDQTLSGGSTLGGFIGYNQRWLFGIHTILVGAAGVSMIATQDINSKSLDNKTGLTLALGMTMPIEKSFQAGFFFGADHIGGRSGEEWGHDDKLWISLSIGYAFLQ